MKMHEYSAEIQFATSSHSQASNKFFPFNIFYCKLWLLTCIIGGTWFRNGFSQVENIHHHFGWIVFTQTIGMLCIGWSMNWHFSTEIDFKVSHEKSDFDCPPFESRTRQEIQNFLYLFAKWKRLINSSDTRLCASDTMDGTHKHTLKVVDTFNEIRYGKGYQYWKCFQWQIFVNSILFSPLSKGNWIVKVLADCFTSA